MFAPQHLSLFLFLLLLLKGVPLFGPHPSWLRSQVCEKKSSVHQPLCAFHWLAGCLSVSLSVCLCIPRVGCCLQYVSECFFFLFFFVFILSLYCFPKQQQQQQQRRDHVISSSFFLAFSKIMATIVKYRVATYTCSESVNLPSIRQCTLSGNSSLRQLTCCFIFCFFGVGFPSLNAKSSLERCAVDDLQTGL